MIHLEKVTKTYPSSVGAVDALKAVDLDIPEGQFIAIRGPSGCGKSTLLTIVGALNRPTSGRVVVAGENLGQMTPAERARFRGQKIGFVFQMFHLLPYLNVLDNVLTAAEGKATTEIRDRAESLLDSFEMGHRITHRPAELSAGERQRVAVARAMLNRPSMILADEPTGNLDPESATDVLSLLAGFHEEGGSVLLVTHDPLAAQFAQTEIRLRDGRIES